MPVDVNSPQDLAALLCEANHMRVGIDGVTGCGKSTLAHALSEQLEIESISLDDYLNRNQGGYLDHLRYEDLKRDFVARSTCIVEGVCLLAALKSAGLTIDALIYVRRMSEGVWADECECVINENVEVFLERERNLLRGGPAATESESGLPPLAEEIIRYHASYRPFESATVWYQRDDC